MPPPKKAAKKVAKKAAKKSARHNDRNDLRRTYEHLGRVQVLQAAVDVAPNLDVKTLVALAQRELKDRQVRNAAELLRAAEHLSFAATDLSGSGEPSVSDPLLEAITMEFDHLTHRASEHWDRETDRHTSVSTIYKRTQKRAVKAFQLQAFRQSLELARASEALSHVKKHSMEALQSGAEVLSLSS